MIDNQFYPTPVGLAQRAYHKFTSRDITRLLEPEAGRGDFLDAIGCRDTYYHGRTTQADCIELDLQNQAILRDKGYRVIDGDFLQFSGSGAMYSHVLMNPPFNQGVAHVLKAWDILFDGEIVAIINAASLRNPDSGAARRLFRLIADHGEVEFLQQQFQTEDTQRKTNVEIALVHLTKKASVAYSNPAEGLKEDAGPGIADEVNKQQLALPEPTIHSTVRAFDLAVGKMKVAVMAEDEASYYERLISSALDPSTQPVEVKLKKVQEEINGRYDKLKGMAWSLILQSTEFTQRLSSKVQKKLESDFEQVQKLEFTFSNIYGLLSGLVNQKGQMDMEMVAEVFDLFTRYHSDNRAYYRGWKSNDKHKTCAYRLKMTRFILPLGGYDSFLDYTKKQELFDIDKAFAMLDGKPIPARTDDPEDAGYEAYRNTLFYLADQRFGDLKTSERFQTTYFDVRYYPGTGTMHFFPKRKDLVDKMNRIVGRMRAWLPPEDERVDKKFWVQYDKAEKVTAQMNKTPKYNSTWFRVNEEEALAVLHEAACAKLNIDLSDGLFHEAHKALGVD
jgi:hypothetical protein